MLIQKHFQILSEDVNLAIVTQLELRQSNKELRLRINDVLRGYLNLIDQIIIEGKENGEFLPDLNHLLARQMIFGTIDETVTTWVMNEQKYSLSRPCKRCSPPSTGWMQLEKLTILIEGGLVILEKID